MRSKVGALQSGVLLSGYQAGARALRERVDLSSRCGYTKKSLARQSCAVP